MFKWAQRDRRLALVMLVDLGLVLLVGAVFVTQVLMSNQADQASNGKVTSTPFSPTVATGPIYSLTSPALPTVNPLPLVALPNQGQSDAPLPPAGLLVPTTGLAPTNPPDAVTPQAR